MKKFSSPYQQLIVTRPMHSAHFYWTWSTVKRRRRQRRLGRLPSRYQPIDFQAEMMFEFERLTMCSPPVQQNK